MIPNINSLPLSPNLLHLTLPPVFWSAAKLLKPTLLFLWALLQPLLSLHRKSQVLGLDIHTHWVAQGRAREREAHALAVSVRLRAEFTGECQVCDGMGLILSWFRGPREPVLTCWMSLWKRRWAPTLMDGGLVKGFSWWKKRTFCTVCVSPSFLSPLLVFVVGAKVGVQWLVC